MRAPFGPLLAVLALGVTLRVAWVLSGTFEPVSEAQFYHQHAVDLASGRGYVNPETGAPTAFLPPAYPALLSLPYRLLQPSVSVAGVLNSLLAGFSIVGTFLIGRELGGGRVALAGALILSVFPSQVLYASAVHSDHLTAALVTWILYFALRSSGGGRPSGGLLVASGALTGLAALTAPQTLVLAPLTALLVILRRPPRREAFRRALLVCTSAVLVVAPWSIRNLIQLHTLEPVSTNGGVNLWIGNNERSGSGWMAWEDFEGGWKYPVGETETDRTFFSEALRFALRNPARTLGHWPGKIRHTYLQDYNYVEHFSLEPRAQALPRGMNGRALNWLAYRYYYAVLLLAAPGLVLCRRHGGPIVAIAVGAMTAPTVLFFGLDRFHVAMLPALAAASAVTLTAALDSVRRVRLRTSPVPIPRLSAAARERPAESGAATRIAPDG